MGKLEEDNMLNYKKSTTGFTPVVNFRRLKSTTGFTLLEILLVVGIIAILAGIVIVAINPSRQLAQARNTERVSDLRQINNALQQYYIDHGSYPASLTATLTEVCNTGSLASSSVPGDFCTGKTDLSVLVPTYLTAIPADPQASNVSSSTTSYKVIKYSSTGKIGLEAVLAEQGKNIVINIPAEPCAGTPAVGTLCADGTKYVSATLRTTPSDAGTMKWSTEWIVTGATSDSDGAANTAHIMTQHSTGTNYPAAEYCAGLVAHGHNDWYLPARNELNTLFINRVAIGNFNLSGNYPGSYYWSSTEVSFNDDFAWYQYFLDGDQNTDYKNATDSVRCVRRP